MFIGGVVLAMDLIGEFSSSMDDKQGFGVAILSGSILLNSSGSNNWHLPVQISSSLVMMTSRFMVGVVQKLETFLIFPRSTGELGSSV